HREILSPLALIDGDADLPALGRQWEVSVLAGANNLLGRLAQNRCRERSEVHGHRLKPCLLVFWRLVLDREGQGQGRDEVRYRLLLAHAVPPSSAGKRDSVPIRSWSPSGFSSTAFLRTLR